MTDRAAGVTLSCCKVSPPGVTLQGPARFLGGNLSAGRGYEVRLNAGRGSFQSRREDTCESPASGPTAGRQGQKARWGQPLLWGSDAG